MQEQEIQEDPEQSTEQYSRMSDLPEEVLGPRTYQPGQAMEGDVVRVDKDGIIVNVGLKMEGLVPSEEMRHSSWGRSRCTTGRTPLASASPSGHLSS